MLNTFTDFSEIEETEVTTDRVKGETSGGERSKEVEIKEEILTVLRKLSPEEGMRRKEWNICIIRPAILLSKALAYPPATARRR